jgi:hypothetical protein
MDAVNKQRSSLLVLLLAVFFLGCHSAYYTEYGASRPRRPDYRLSKYNFSLYEGALIDTNAVYLYKTRCNNEDCYYFLRFFREGKVYYSYDYPKEPTEEEFNNVRDGVVGYYILDGDKLTFEIFGKKSDTHNYSIYKGIVSEEGVLLLSERLRPGAGYKYHDMYKKKQVNLYTRPDW